MPTQEARQDGKELTLGILFILDNAPDPPKDMEWREYSEWAIAEHLKRHSYYHYLKGKRTLATVAKMRSRMLDMCPWNRKPTMPKPNRRGEFKDNVDMLFGCGGTDLLQKRFLENQGYDRSTFSESQLSKHVSEAENPGDAKTDGRPEDETSEENNGSDTVASKINSLVVGEEERRESENDAAESPSIQPALPSPSSQVGTPAQLPDNSHSAPRSNSIGNHETREQNGITSDEQLPPSRNEGRRLRSSVGPQTQTPSIDNGISCINEKASAAPSETRPGPQNESVAGAKRKPTQDHGPHKRQCQVNNTTHQDKPSGQEPGVHATTQAERPSKVPSTANGTNASEAPQSAVPDRKNQPKPQLAGLNLDQQGRNMKSLYSAIQQATDAILSSIGQIRNTPSPLQPNPSDPLKDLYARCWGSQWEEMRVRQVGDHVFTTPQVTASLLSAYLYEKVLTERVRLEEIVRNVLEMGGAIGEALLEEFDISGRGAAIAKRARMIEAQKACSKLAQDDNSLHQQLDLEATALAKSASTIFAPHLSALSSSAKLFGLSSNHPETATLTVFKSEFAKAIQRTLYYRLQLLATGCEYAFTWPGPDESFDSGSMQIDGGRAENSAGQSVVLFTVFPGLEIKPTSSNEMEAIPDARAVVKVQRSEDRF